MKTASSKLITAAITVAKKLLATESDAAQAVMNLIDDELGEPEDVVEALREAGFSEDAILDYSVVLRCHVAHIELAELHKRLKGPPP
jgi:hypothetical protein